MDGGGSSADGSTSPQSVRQRQKTPKKQQGHSEKSAMKMGRSPTGSPRGKREGYSKMSAPTANKSRQQMGSAQEGMAWGRLLIIVLACTLYGAMLVFTSMANGFPKNNFFHNQTENVSRGYDVEIFPAVWTFAAWGLVFNWQLLWLCYGISTIWRRGTLGPLYIVPGHLPAGVYVWFCVTCVSVIAWLLLWDRQLPQYAMITSVTMPTSLYGALYLAYTALRRTQATLVKEDKAVDIGLTRGFVLNGLACFAAWVTVAAQVNLAVVLTYTLGWPQHVASTMSLCVLLAGLMVWLPLDLLVMQKNYSRYVISPYPILVIASVGILAKNWDPENSNSILTAFILITAILATLIKLILVFKRQ